jgi:hypothetical protein
MKYPSFYRRFIVEIRRREYLPLRAWGYCYHFNTYEQAKNFVDDYRGDGRIYDNYTDEILYQVIRFPPPPPNTSPTKSR